MQGRSKRYQRDTRRMAAKIRNSEESNGNSRMGYYFIEKTRIKK